MIETAFVFYSDRGLLSGGACFGVRYDAQALPAGSVVCAVYQPDSGFLLNKMPAYNRAQAASLRETLRDMQRDFAEWSPALRMRDFEPEKF